MLNLIMLIWWYSVGSSVEIVPYPPGLEPGTCGVRIHYNIRSPTQLLLLNIHVGSYFVSFIIYEHFIHFFFQNKISADFMK